MKDTTIYTVTYDNEVLGVFTSYFQMREFIWKEFEKDFYDIESDYEYTIIDEQNCLNFIDELGVWWQKFTIKI